MGVIIKSFGHFIPEHRIRNSELANRFGITEEYIVEKTGIYERRYNLEGGISDMIIKAALPCIEKAGISANDIDSVIVGTITPDYTSPSAASVVHHKLGMRNASAFDVAAACAGYIYALELGVSLINSGSYKNILVCGAEKLSSITDPGYRKTSLLFGDGAGVTLLQYSSTQNDISDIICRLDSGSNMDASILLGGSKTPLTKENISDEGRYARFYSKDVFENGVELMRRVIQEIMERNKISFDEIDYIVPHQANKRMIESLVENLNLPIEKFIIDIEYIGNTGAATIPIAISEALQKGTIKKNKKLLLASVGSGFAYAAAIVSIGDINV